MASHTREGNHDPARDAVHDLKAALFGDGFGGKGALAKMEESQTRRHEANEKRISAIETDIRDMKKAVKTGLLVFVVTAFACGSGTVTLASLVEFFKHFAR